MDTKGQMIAQKLHKDREEILRFCSRYKRLHLFGAGYVASAMLQYLQEENISIADVIVSENKGQGSFKGLSVYSFAECSFNEEDGIFLGVGFTSQESVQSFLEEHGISNANIYAQRIYGFNPNPKPMNVSSLPVEKVAIQGRYFADFQELNEIGIKYNTDKCSNYHSYLDKYEFFIRRWKNEPIIILELGVFKGGSIKMWEAYFTKAKIYGVDIDEACKCYESDRSKIIIQDLADENELKKLAELHPQIIVDDASHIWSHQIKAIFQLFPRLSQGGVFIMEDLETSFSAFRALDEYRDSCVSTYEFLSAIAEVMTSGEYLQTVGLKKEIYLLKDEIEMIAQQVELISFMHESCILIKK